MDINAVDVTVGAVVLPPVIAIVNQRRWPAQLKGLVALLVCLLYVTVAAFVRGELHLADWRAAALQVCVAAFGAYRLWWQPSGIAPAIEAATSAATGAGTGSG